MDIGPNLNSYDYIIVFFSGGKDSLACLLHLIEEGIDMSKVELWHHDVDGRGENFMDWPVTPAYCQAVADHLKVPLYFSWREGGFKREMLRNESPTAPVKFETPDVGIVQVGGKGKPGTRLKFPQVSTDLRVRWCSAYLKIDVSRIAINNQPRFKSIRTLVISGERAEESPGRAKYKTFEPENHRAGRQVDRWRPVHKWSEKQIWDIIERFGINPHPAYHLGWGRVSCKKCIFGSDNQWCSIGEIDPFGLLDLAQYEEDFGVTIHRSRPLLERVERGTPYQMNSYVDVAQSSNYTQPIHLEDWRLPAGAFGESCGPT